MAKFVIEELYRIYDKVADTIQKEHKVEEFFKKYPKFLPKKKWYKSDCFWNLIIILVFFIILSIQFTLFL